MTTNEKIFLFLLFIAFFLFLLNFYVTNKDAVQQIEVLNQKIKTLENENAQLGTELKNTKSKLDQANANYDELKEETSILLVRYFAQEAVWDVIGAKKLRLICGIGKIALRDSIPDVKKLPC